ncbi:hypothetical protein FNCV3_17250 [Fusobacterium nucleatum]|nr:hypothetical protein FNCV3_17250 [Fusobacterium nucleatum]BEP06623.1 hypothetical protein FNSV3_19700 [Fusobacterium nucleatum]
MRERILKNKLILIALSAVLLVSCGDSGGRNSNVAVNPGNNVSPIPKKPGVEDKINPTNPENAVNPSVPTPSKPSKPINPTNNVKRESLEELRARMDETKVREFIFNEQNNSIENIPMDSRVLNGDKVKVGVLDGDFINKKNYLENKYRNIEILERDHNPKHSNHGELVLKALREKNKLGIIAGSIGENDDFSGREGTAVIPKLETYEKVLEKFNPNQKVKVFSQSWGVPETIGSYIWKSEEERMRAIAPGQTSNEGRKILDFYKKEVKKDTLFVWANGNTLINNQNQIGFLMMLTIKEAYLIFIQN